MVLLLQCLNANRQVGVECSSEVVRQMTEAFPNGGSEVLAEALIRCCLGDLGRDRGFDGRLAALLSEILTRFAGTVSYQVISEAIIGLLDGNQQVLWSRWIRDPAAISHLRAAVLDRRPDLISKLGE